MASEKITKIIDAVKELSVLELKELIDSSTPTARSSAFPPWPLPLPLPLLLLPLLRRRPSSTLCWLRLAPTRWPLSRP